MAIEIKLPELGESIDSATVTRVLVKVGDAVKAEQPILEVDTDKASVDVPASSSGSVKEIRVKEGDVINVGQIVMTLEEAGSAAAPPPPAKPSEPSPAKTEPVKTPAVEARPAEPEVKKETAQETSAPVQVPQPPQPQQSPEETPEAVDAAPSLRRMARELGIDIHAVAGTGPEGRITEEDIRNYARSIILNASGVESVTKVSRMPDFSRWGAVESKAMSGVRRAIAEHMYNSWSSIPHVTQFDTADITELDEERKSLEKKAGGKLTVTAIALKVAAAALKVFPQFNVSVDPQRGEIISKKYIHIGVAVDTDHGLLVPVIRDVNQKNLHELSEELTQAAEKARNRTLGLEEMQGGTFTITNLGGIGGVNFTPIVNSPEVAILGISRSSVQPVFRDGELKPRLILPLALSYDHRAVDGADGARFLRWVAEAFEQPLKLLLEG
jgi:pyruvate dehydrogenase E2 component (dihydrolipoyllysine-residue acetyltransferase)